MNEHCHFTLYGQGPCADAEKCNTNADSMDGAPDVSIGGREGTGITEFTFDRSEDSASVLRLAINALESCNAGVCPIELAGDVDCCG